MSFAFSLGRVKNLIHPMVPPLGAKREENASSEVKVEGNLRVVNQGLGALKWSNKCDSG